jgi:hypothetical protein
MTRGCPLLSGLFLGVRHQLHECFLLLLLYDQPKQKMGGSNSKGNVFQTHHWPAKSFGLDDSIFEGLDPSERVQAYLQSSSYNERLKMTVASVYHFRPARVLVLCPLHVMASECQSAFCDDSTDMPVVVPNAECVHIESNISWTDNVYPLPCLVIQTLSDARISPQYLQRYQSSDFPLVVMAEAQHYTPRVLSLIQSYFDKSSIVQIKAPDKPSEIPTDCILQDMTACLEAVLRVVKKKPTRCLVLCETQAQANLLIMECNLRFAPTLFAASENSEFANVMVQTSVQMDWSLDANFPWASWGLFVHSGSDPVTSQYIQDRILDSRNTLDTYQWA